MTCQVMNVSECSRRTYPAASAFARGELAHPNQVRAPVWTLSSLPRIAPSTLRQSLSEVQIDVRLPLHGAIPHRPDEQLWLRRYK